MAGPNGVSPPANGARPRADGLARAPGPAAGLLPQAREKWSAEAAMNLIRSVLAPAHAVPALSRTESQARFDSALHSLENTRDHVRVEDLQALQALVEEDAATAALMAESDPLHGLAGAQAAERLARFGRNAIPEAKANPFLKFLSYFIGSIAFLIEAAMILAAVVGDWINFGIIGALLLVNALIGFVEEAKAESALDALKQTLALRSRAVRDGHLAEIDATELVPGDVIVLRLGDIVPADAVLLPYNSAGDACSAPLQVDQSALTGESLPTNKRPGALVMSSSIVRQGQLRAMVAHTGTRTFVGRAAGLVLRASSSMEAGHFQKVIGHIGNFLVVITVTMVAILLAVGIAAHGMEPLDMLSSCLVITIASIPVGLPTVMSVTMAVGAKQLAKRKVIVKRLTAVEELAGVTILCSDKTGTLTKNELSVDEPYLPEEGDYRELMTAAFLASEPATNDPIERTVRAAAERALFVPDEDDVLAAHAAGEGAQLNGANVATPAVRGASEPATAATGDGDRDIEAGARPGDKALAALTARPAHTAAELGYSVLRFVPFSPETKIVQAAVRGPDGEVFGVVKGAPQKILNLCMEGRERERDRAAEGAVLDLAKRGLRALGVARTEPGSPFDPNPPDAADATAPSAPAVSHDHGASPRPGGPGVCWKLLGFISLLDPPREDSAATIERARSMGVSVKMITGDQQVIAKEVAHRLGMGRCILDASRLVEAARDATPELEAKLAITAEKVDGFAQVIPEHKYRVVELLQERGHLVGMTGDGVNDAPALKKANVGIAVHGCTDAARSAADIVLLSPGLSTIIDGILTSRAIFQRMRSYALYRIASTIHFLLFFFITLLVFNWSLPAIQIVLICLLNDAATLVISVDNAVISKRPDKWRLGQLLFLSTVYAGLLMASSFAHLFVANRVFHYPMAGFDVPMPMRGRERVPLTLDTIMYLQISSCPHFVIFSSRLTDYWWRSPPSLIFFLAIIGTQIFAMILSIVGDASGPLRSAGIDPLFAGAPIRLNGFGPPPTPFHNPGRIDLAAHGGDINAVAAAHLPPAWAGSVPASAHADNLPRVASPIGPGWGFSIMAISFAYMILMDLVKVAIYKRWNYALTVFMWPLPGRVRELTRRRKLAVAAASACHRWAKVWAAVRHIERERIKLRLARLGVYAASPWIPANPAWRPVSHRGESLGGRLSFGPRRRISEEPPPSPRRVSTASEPALPERPPNPAGRAGAVNGGGDAAAAAGVDSALPMTPIPQDV